MPMIQDYSKYTQEDQDVWNILFERQISNLSDKVCPEYLDCLNTFKSVLNSNSIPRFNELREVLGDSSGWGLEVVPGLIPVEEFFQLLSEKKFCSSTWVRSRDMLDYLEEPDMFHDVFGHTPLILNERYADFMHEFGKMGVRFGHDPEAVLKLQRLYWFTIEFGLMRTNGETTIYGAGIASSFGETNHVYEDQIEVLPFDIESVMNNVFINSEIQTRYYYIGSLEELFNLVESALAILEKPTTTTFIR